MKKQTLAIIVAGGRGSRLLSEEKNHGGKTLPKQYRQLAGRSILDITVGKFTAHAKIDHVLVVIHRDDAQFYAKSVTPHDKLLAPVTGGSSRQQSAHCGLAAAQNLGQIGKVLIHDGARPFVEESTISNVLRQSAPGICAIAAHAMPDTLKKSNDHREVIQTVSRHNIYCAQTPQGFMIDEIFKIHQRAAHGDGAIHDRPQFSDDASLFEAAGLPVKIVDSPSSNFKITTGDDLARARMITETSTQDSPVLHADIRTGNGYDVHAFAPGDGLILCGHKIAFDKKLSGHSDADVALHALTDALLGTIGAGDIGLHFPPTDQRWQGASSHLFLNHALSMVAKAGGLINNIDITIICELPKIGPHRSQMCKHLAHLCGVEIRRVSIKATTTEKLGFLGRGEGIAALATATLSFGTRL